MNNKTLKFTQNSPAKEGWYFWKRSKSITDPFRYSTYYIEFLNDDDGFEVDSEGNRVNRQYWDGTGLLISAPRGGWWCPILTIEVI